jgi:hypothetical protein
MIYLKNKDKGSKWHWGRQGQEIASFGKGLSARLIGFQVDTAGVHSLIS